MLFYRTSPDYRLAIRGGVAARGGFAPGAASSADSAATLRATWMIKSFVTGIALLGLAYWLVQIAGAQYLATLTSATLLSFLLVYIVWCLTVRRRHHPQSPDSVVTAESVSGPTVAVRPPAPLNPALKHYGVPPRECSPPPSYEEVLRQMGAAAAAAGSNASALYEDTVATTSSTAPCDINAQQQRPLASRTPPIASLSIEFPPSESASNESPGLGSPSLDTPSIGTPSMRTPSIETLSMCAPRLGMLSVGLSPERQSPEDTPPVEMPSPLDRRTRETLDAINALHINDLSPSDDDDDRESSETPLKDAEEPTSPPSSAQTPEESVLASTPTPVISPEAASTEASDAGTSEVAPCGHVADSEVAGALDASLRGAVSNETVSIEMPATEEPKSQKKVQQIKYTDHFV